MRALAVCLSLLLVGAATASDSDADARADAGVSASVDADIDASAGASKWDHYDLRVAMETAGTDGEMYWLRSAHIRGANVVDNGGRQHGTILVGDAAMPAPTRTGDFDLNPPQPPLLHQDIADWNNNANGLLPAHKAWIKAHATAFAALKHVGGGPFPPAVVAAAGFANCEQTIVNALVGAATAAGQVGANDALAAWALQNMFSNGQAGTCTLPIPLALVQKWAAVIAAHAAGWTALEAHYDRLRAYANGNPVDVWELRGWLYATDRAHGHRVVGATGYAVALAGSADIGAERRFVKQRFMNTPGHVGYVFGNPGPAHWGLGVDTCGHVRPRAFGGERDPINFVPQSATGQKFVNAAEELTLELITHCTGNPRVRYGVYFTYNGNAVTDRRPTRARTVVDLIGNCGNAGHRLGPVDPVAAGNAIFNWDTATY